MAMYQPSNRPWAGNLMINPHSQRCIAWGRVCVVMVPLLLTVLAIGLLLGWLLAR